MSQATAPAPRSWDLALPTSIPLLNSNQRPHWRDKATKTKTIRRAAHALAHHRFGPLGLDRVRITVTVRPGPRTRRLDPHNLQPTAKAMTDGLVDARVIADDDSTRLVAMEFVAGPRHPDGMQVVLTITEVA